MMNSIVESQNQPKQLRRLVSQRALYSAAKRYYWFQIVGSVLLPTTFALLALYMPGLSGYAALYALCFLVFDLSLLEGLVSDKKNKAAQIQEKFDCDVLQIPPSPISVGGQVTTESELEHSMHGSDRGVEDWYPKAISQFRLPVARLLCQRTNVYWDARIRTSYSNWLRGIVSSIGFFVVVIGVLNHLQFERVVLILGTLSPFMRFSIKEYVANRDATNRLRRLTTFFEVVWLSIKDNSCDDRTLLTYARSIQDELFVHRSRSPLIPDVMYKMTREQTEDVTDQTIQMLAQELENV